MKKLVCFVALVFLPVSCFAYSIVYDRVDGRIYFGAQNVNYELSVSTRYVVKQIDAGSPLLKNNIENIKYDEPSGSFVKKSDSEILEAAKEKRKKDIRKKVRHLKQKKFEALQERAEMGTDVNDEINSIQSEIENLKLEYKGI